MELITSEMKDKMLAFLLAPESNRFTITFNDSCEEELGMKIDSAMMILKDFHNKGIIKAWFFKPDCVKITVNVLAHDIWAKGGYTVQQEILKANIEKLDLQLQLLAHQLGTDYLEAANKIASIGSVILSALPLFK